MFSHLYRLIFLILFPSFLLFSCAPREAEDGHFLSSYPLNVRAEITFDGRIYEAEISICDENELSVSFLSPSSLSGTAVSLKDGVGSITFDGITVPITDGGYSSENGILLLRHIFSLESKSFRDADVKTVSGIKYCIEHYRVPEGEIDVYFPNASDIPNKVEARLNGHEISLQMLTNN